MGLPVEVYVLMSSFSLSLFSWLFIHAVYTCLMDAIDFWILSGHWKRESLWTEKTRCSVWLFISYFHAFLCSEWRNRRHISVCSGRETETGTRNTSFTFIPFPFQASLHLSSLSSPPWISCNLIKRKGRNRERQKEILLKLFSKKSLEKAIEALSFFKI